MNKSGRLLLSIILCLFTASVLILTMAGCESSTVSKVIFSGQEISDIKVLDQTDSLESAPAGTELYANVLFIESPKGMEYGVKWTRDGSVVKEDAGKMGTDRKGVISYRIEGDKLTSGEYTLEIYYKDKKIHEAKIKAE